MIERAKSKIKEEMTNNCDPYIQVVGKYILNNIEINKVAAKNIVEGKKSIKASLEAMRKEAEKKRVGNCAVLTDEEGFKIIRTYFEFEATQDKILRVEFDRVKEENSIARDDVKEKIKFNVSIDDLL